jgi:hypothetical protein
MQVISFSALFPGRPLLTFLSISVVSAKFFDLSPEDTEEVNQVKLSIHLNLAQCYLKMENWDFVRLSLPSVCSS